MKKEHNVVMLPTQKTIITPFGNNFITMLSLGIGKYIKDLTFQKYMDGMQVPNPQHLYFTANEEPKVGDWAIDGNDELLFIAEIKVASNIVRNGSGITSVLAGCKKVVATTDPELWYERKAYRGSEYIHTENALLPKIGLDFVEAYIREYNAGKPITKVMLEYGETRNELDNPHRYVPVEFLKLRENGTVIISEVKEKLYTRDQVQQIIEQALQYGSEGDIMNFNYWFDKNYPL